MRSVVQVTLGLSILVFLVMWALPATSQGTDAVTVRYLGSSGWAITAGHRLLIFDYQQETDPSPPPRDKRCLENGYIQPEELAGYDVFVFTTHPHFDHYSQAIYGWESRVDSITYLFGWEAGSNPGHYYLDEWRERATVDGLEVCTIYSHHSGVPEVAFLVLADGVSIYHNGDYMADYEEDFEYLRTITDRIDLAFVVGHPDVEHSYYRQTLRMNELFDLTYVFPMNREGEAFRCHEFAQLLTQDGVTATLLVAETRGEVFELDL